MTGPVPHPFAWFLGDQVVPWRKKIHAVVSDRRNAAGNYGAGEFLDYPWTAIREIGYGPIMVPVSRSGMSQLCRAFLWSEADSHLSPKSPFSQERSGMVMEKLHGYSLGMVRSAFATTPT